MSAGPQKGNYIVVFQPSIFRCKLAVRYILRVYFPEKEKKSLRESTTGVEGQRGSQAPPLASVASLPLYQPPGGMAGGFLWKLRTGHWQ